MNPETEVTLDTVRREAELLLRYVDHFPKLLSPRKQYEYGVAIRTHATVAAEAGQRLTEHHPDPFTKEESNGQ